MKFIHGKLVFCPKSTSLSGMENYTGKERYFDATIIKMIVSNKKQLITFFILYAFLVNTLYLYVGCHIITF